MPPNLTVLQPGFLTTIQDLGRTGYQALGVPVAGALDFIGLRQANALVGNAPGEGCLEISYLGPTLQVEADSVRLAVVGELRFTLTEAGGSSRNLATNCTHRLNKGDVLAVGGVSGASVAYMAVAGGFDLPPVLGSLSTYLRAGLGPLQGSALKEGTVLPLRVGEADGAADRALGTPFNYGDGPVRVILGPQEDRFTEDALAAFLSSDYLITKEADRMGLRLDGPPLAHRGRADITSDALVSGCIQVPGDGRPIILLADHQTTGGYAKIATVIWADLPRVSRSVPGTRLRFRAVSVAEGEAARRALEDEFQRCVAGIHAVDTVGRIDLDRLYSANLVSGLVDAITGQGDAT